MHPPTYISPLAESVLDEMRDKLSNLQVQENQT